MRRWVKLLLVGCVWLLGAYFIQMYTTRSSADPLLPNPALAVLNFQTGPAQLPTVTPFPTATTLVIPTATTRVLVQPTATPVGSNPQQVIPTLPSPILPILQTPVPTARQGTPGGPPPTLLPGQPTLNPAQATAQAGRPGQTPTRPGGLPPTIQPIQGTRLPGATAPTGSGGVGGTATVTPTVAVTGTRATATAPLGSLKTFTGRIISKDPDTNTLVIRMPNNQGEITVTPGDDTEIRRDSIATSFASLDVGDQATLVLGPDDELLRILVTTTPVDASPTATDEASSSNVLTVVWQALLGLVMMGVVLIIDSELRTKFMAALLEPSGAYPTGRR